MPICTRTFEVLWLVAVIIQHGRTNNVEQKHLEEENEGRVEIFQQGAQKIVKKILSKFNSYDFYLSKVFPPSSNARLINVNRI